MLSLIIKEEEEEKEDTTLTLMRAQNFVTIIKNHKRETMMNKRKESS